MAFLQPYWLWGMLAVAIPVAIHFWNQKKGKTIEWAASRWLLEKTTLNHRGIRLYEIPLMLLRCLLVILLALILGKPVMDWLNESAGNHKIHLVQPDKLVVDNYRFELDAALKKGDKLYWISSIAAPINDLSETPNVTRPELYLQQTINKTAAANSDLQLYLLAGQQFAENHKVYVPGSFKIFPVADSSRSEDVLLKFDAAKKWNVFLGFKNASEQATVGAALKALSAVYQIPFNMDLTLNPGKKYDLILSDSIHKPVDLQTLYIVSGKSFRADLPENVIQVPDSLLLTSSGLVESGRLPEWLGEILVEHYDMDQTRERLSSSQLQAMFVRTKPAQETGADEIRKWLLLIFALAALLERWISLRKTVSAYV